MVVSQLRSQNLRDEDVDLLFHALADTTRRDIIVRAAAGDLSVSALARNYAMSVTAIQKHVAVLESAGLVRKQRQGREQLVTPAPEAFETVRRILDRIEGMWRDRLDRFGEVLADLPADLPADPTEGKSS